MDWLPNFSINHNDDTGSTFDPRIEPAVMNHGDGVVDKLNGGAYILGRC